MHIVTTLILVLLGLAICFAVIAFQMVTLARIYRSWSWWVGASTFGLLGAKQTYGVLKLPSMILQAQLKGVMIDHLSAEQWINVGWSYLIAVGFIVWLDWLRRDLSKIGL